MPNALSVFSSFLLKTPVASFEYSKVDNHDATKFKLVKQVRMKRGKSYQVAVYLSKRLHEINLQIYLQNSNDRQQSPKPISVSQVFMPFTLFTIFDIKEEKVDDFRHEIPRSTDE